MRDDVHGMSSGGGSILFSVFCFSFFLVSVSVLCRVCLSGLSVPIPKPQQSLSPIVCRPVRITERCIRIAITVLHGLC